MEPKLAVPEQPRFSSPEEELKYLREEILRKEKALREKGAAPERAAVVQETVSAYAHAPVNEVLATAHALPAPEAGAIVLDLTPEPHDKQMEGLLAVVQSKGVRNAFTVVEKMNSPHLYDDLHRFLIQYLQTGLPVRGLPERSPLWRPLHMTLFEISLPEASKEDAEKELKALIAGMEQFYAGMLGGAERGAADAYFTMEIANANGSDEAVF